MTRQPATSFGDGRRQNHNPCILDIRCHRANRPRLHRASAKRAEANLLRESMLHMMVGMYCWFVHVLLAVRRRTSASAIIISIAAIIRIELNDSRRSSIGRRNPTSAVLGLSLPPVADANRSKSP